MHRLRVVISMLALVALWQLVIWAEWVPETYFPGPAATFQALWSGLRGGELASAAALTALRTLLGLIAATAAGLCVALLTARYRRLREAFDPIAEFLRPLPPAALVPLAIFFLGLNWKLHGFIVVFACIWPVYLNANSAMKSLPSVQLRTAASFGYQGWTRVLHVQLPAALPDIFTGIRIAAAVALIATIVTEMLAGRDGMGYYMNDAAMTLRIPETFAALILVMLTGLALNGLVLGVRNSVVAWNIGLTASNRG